MPEVNNPSNYIVHVLFTTSISIIVTGLLSYFATNLANLTSEYPSYMRATSSHFVIDDGSMLLPTHNFAFAADGNAVVAEDDRSSGTSNPAENEEMKSQQIRDRMEERVINSKKNQLYDERSSPNNLVSPDNTDAKDIEDRNLRHLNQEKYREVRANECIDGNDSHQNCTKEQFCKSIVNKSICTLDGLHLGKDSVPMTPGHKENIESVQKTTAKEDTKYKESNGQTLNKFDESTLLTATIRPQKSNSYLAHHSQLEEEQSTRLLNQLVSGNERFDSSSKNTSDVKQNLVEVNNSFQESEGDFTLSCPPLGIIMGKEATGSMTCVIHNKSPIAIKLKLTCSGLEKTGIECFVNENSKTTTIVIERVSTKTFSVVTVISSIHNNDVKLYPFTVSANNLYSP